MTGHAPGSGYFIAPTLPGPGVLLLHSFWGLNRAAKDTADRLADEGFTVLAPDLAGGGVYTEMGEALAALGEADMDVVAALVQSSVGILRRAQADPERPIGVIGYGSGASWALWLSARSIDEVAAVVTYYGSQSIPMDTSNSSYLCHWAETDRNVTDLEVADLGLRLQMANRPFHFEHHSGTIDGFAEPGRPGHDPDSEAKAWLQTTDFLTRELQREIF